MSVCSASLAKCKYNILECDQLELFRSYLIIPSLFNSLFDMMHKQLVFRQLSRHICTRRIQFPLQNLYVVSFSNNDHVIRCFIGKSKDVFTV